jgi:two-component system sensor histidine kinase VanS
MFLSTLTWYDNDALYPLLLGIRDNIFILTIIYLSIGYVIILYMVLKKNYLYFVSILEAIEAIKEDNHELVEIPYSELREVSHYINSIKSDLQRNIRAAKEAEQKKNDLVVYLAHDLKTPLTSVIGYLTLLKDERQISEEIQQRYLQITLDKAERLEDLINEFFEITRLNLTKQILEVQSINFTRLMEQITYEFKPMFMEKNITCDMHIPKDLQLTCDVIKIQRVIDNILRNAVNYAYPDSTIAIHIEVLEQHIQMTFTNQGPTIPKEKLDHIFEQFYRTDSARTSGTGGAGLGLAIAKEIVTLHGGTIQSTSEKETTCFIISLPS